MKKICVILLIFIMGCQKNTAYQKAINLYTRDFQSGARSTFLEKIKLDISKSNDELFKNGYLEVMSNSDMKIKIKNDPNGIGYISYAQNLEGIKSLPIDGIEPSLENMHSGKYPLIRFVSVLKTSRTLNYTQEKILEAYLDFMMNTYEASILFNQNGIVKKEENLQLWKDVKEKHEICSRDLSEETIKIGGSTSYYQISQKIKESFASKCGNVNLILNHKGSTDGIEKTVGSEKDQKLNLDLAFLSRDLTAEEQLNIAPNSLYKVAFDVLLVVINQRNQWINDINLLELNKIYRGERIYW